MLTPTVQAPEYGILRTPNQPIRMQDSAKPNNNKQLLNEFENDIENHQGRGLRYLPKLKAELVDNMNRSQGLDYSRYHAKTESNNCFVMYSKPKNKE